MNEIDNYSERRAMYQNASAQKQQEVLFFLCFCTERLKAGKTVESIWNEWQEATA